jgi:hypothetical protein
MKLMHGLNRKEKDWHDVLSYHQMYFLVLLSCDPKPDDRRDFQNKWDCLDKLYQKVAIQELTRKQFIGTNEAGEHYTTLAGFEFLRTYTQRKDIREFRNQVTISD